MLVPSSKVVWPNIIPYGPNVVTLVSAVKIMTFAIVFCGKVSPM